MKKVLIVEDEILARLGLRQLVDWRKLELELLPDATDGEEALEMIRNSCPDIILLDLNIPKVSGLEILEFLKKEEMPTKVIVVSCQEEFDVVKKAMKLGAYDYLRKLNLSSDELENILEKCLVETEERITVHMQGIREIRYEEIVRDSRDILAGACNYQTLICILAKDTEELSRVTEIIHKWAETELREGLQIQKGNQYGYFLLEEKPEKSVYMELKKRAERKTGRELYMGIFEGCMEKTADIVRAAAMAEQIQLFSYYDKEEKLVFFQKKIETEGHSPRGMHGYLDSLKEKIRSFDREKTEQELHGIFGLIRQESYISINVLRRNFMDILGIYSMVAQSLNGALEEIELDGDNCHYQKIMMMESLREIEKWFLKFNDIFMEKFWIAYKCSRSEILQKVVKYIEVHIMEPIHLSDAAAETGVSSAYLSTMFKKEMGYNFIEYVNLRKIELARQMLQDGKMVYEVSELLGFENSTYFSRVFKRYTDVSPRYLSETNVNQTQEIELTILPVYDIKRKSKSIINRERGESYYESVICKKPCCREKIYNQRNGTGWYVCSSSCSNITDFTANAYRCTDHHSGIWCSTCRRSTWFQAWNYSNTGLRSVRSHRSSDLC